MSYESNMLRKLSMPTRRHVEQALLRSLLRHGGVIKEFGSGQEIVHDIANEFGLNEEQRTAYLRTVYRKENRPKKSLLWHRLLFRAADALAKEKLVTRPTQTLQLTNRREWMLTERGYDQALELSDIPAVEKNLLPTKSFEVQRIAKKLIESPRPQNYYPFDREKRVSRVTRESSLRTRGFRQAVIESYDCKCAVCGLKINSPDSLSWEVEAAHIVPHRSMGRDDIWNGIALCRLHHWAFDVGWFTLLDDFTVLTSTRANSLPSGFGKLGEYEFLRALSSRSSKVFLPNKKEIHPHPNAVRWHRENIFFAENRI
jgi:5-methylcytosine-specific restriction endonuclease McrA